MNTGSFSKLLLHLHPAYIPASSSRVRFTWCLGGLAVWMFVVETITGALLLLHYVPTSHGAYGSVQQIAHVVPYGFFVRNLHYWAGQIMVCLVILHMVRVFVTASYSPPRRMNWLIGLALLVTTFLVDFTGYLLVWDDRALWAWTIASNLARTVPVVGAASSTLLFGPAEAGDAVLGRLYGWHIFLWPLVLFLVMSWHFWKIRKDGGISAPL